MDIYDRLRAVNRSLVFGRRILFSRRRGGETDPHVPPEKDRELRYPRIGIYTGAGASHSWLWFVEIFDRMGFHDLAFLDEAGIRQGGLKGVNVLAMSGGDTFAIAGGLGEKGSAKLSEFIEEGGLYLGSCAGAYLPLNSSKKPLNLFNYVPAKISNLTKTLPQASRLREKFCTPYGCSFIFHPVREAVRLKTNGFTPFRWAGAFDAPLYGGPPMVSTDASRVLATYSGFTDRTLFLVDEKLAGDTMIGKAAVIRSKMGKGHLYLFGPHFEHPRFPVANQLVADAVYWDVRRGTVQEKGRDPGEMALEGGACRLLIKDIKREISNSRIVAVGMENAKVRWTIGNKIYEPAKIREYIEAIWQRIRPLEKLNHMCVLPGQDALMIECGKETTALLRSVRRGINEGADTLQTAKKMFPVLKRTCTLFLDTYFRTKMRHIGDVRCP
jgi:biotin protein ligase-like protein